MFTKEYLENVIRYEVRHEYDTCQIITYVKAKFLWFTYIRKDVTDYPYAIITKDDGIDYSRADDLFFDAQKQLKDYVNYVN